MDTEFTGHFYFLNDYMVIGAFFSIDSPYVTCKTNDSKYFGEEYEILLTSIGPCDKNFIEKYYKKWYSD